MARKPKSRQSTSLTGQKGRRTQESEITCKTWRAGSSLGMRAKIQTGGKSRCHGRPKTQHKKNHRFLQTIEGPTTTIDLNTPSRMMETLPILPTESHLSPQT
jgi:hypothetical protein